MTFTVAIIGRPNVGKSTLFNRLVGKRLALVDDQPGVTRDRREGQGRLADLTFRIIDTAGLEEAFDDSLAGRMRSQTERALADADAVLLLVDARTGTTPLDNHFANWLRSTDKPVILVANKAEGKAAQGGLMDAYALGLGSPVPLSAEHGEGMEMLYDALRPLVDAAEAAEKAAREAAEGDGDGKGERPLALAIVGRPNVGKSTLVNRMLGEERMLTGPEAGVTRDAIASDWAWKGRPVRLVDTAGLRRKSRVSEKLEKLSVAESLRTIRLAEVVVLLLDAAEGLDKQDLTIASHVVEEGRALIIAVNKWDLARDRDATLKAFRDRLATSFAQVGHNIPVVTFSAMTGQGVDKLMPAVFKAHEAWNRRVPTAALNRWLSDMTERHPPPMVKGRRLRLRYMTQIKSRPPTFAVFQSSRGELPDSYGRYLQNGLRDDFGFGAVPIRIYFRSGKNPYADDK
ncbi:ribosome biogenesis GTPase Der [Oceanibacterium hippocampi]|uniref:GTPase Der n=1 Tax=Oceanibacterium hippocampi TaxID=745714 RepID=A0A1Y5SV94_9PROT|nr:ribosome biogenesis GTPase Der [Oceanibacterium hippocampi]SLN47828.1 GTPase Der [Oceanibacterium hippocampi]